MRYVLPFLVFFLFIIEGTVMQVLSPDRFGLPYIVVPRFAFIVVLISGIFLGRAFGTFYGLALGLFQDIVYTYILGIYLFSMTLLAYLLSIPFKIFQKNLFLLILTVLLGTVFLDYLVYGIHFVIGITEIGHERFVFERLLPSTVVNAVFIIVFAYPLRKLMIKLQNNDDTEEKIKERKKEFRSQR